MSRSVLAQITSLKSAPIGDLRAKWLTLFGTTSPRASRAYLVSRLAYRIQELAFGGLRPETLARIEALGGEPGSGGRRSRPRTDRPVAGTLLIREWKGVEHRVVVRNDGYEYAGRPFASLSAVARTITGTRWNGWTFFGLKQPGSGNDGKPTRPAVRRGRA